MDPVTLGAAKADAATRYSRSLLNTFCTLGDSFGSRNRSSSGTPGAAGYVDFYDANLGFLPWMQAFLHGRLVDKGNYAITGTRSDQWISGGQVTSVGAAKPAWCIVTAPTNDREQGISLATTQGYMTTIFNTLRAQGIRVVALGLAPEAAGSVGTTLTIAKMAFTVQYNYWLKTLQMARAGFVTVDPFNSLTTATSGAWIAATGQWTPDNLHPANWSCARIGRLLANALDPLVPYVDMRPMGGFDNPASVAGQGITNLNLSSHPEMSGTGGGATKLSTGTVATGWTVSSSDGNNLAGTVTASIVTATDQTATAWQQIAVTGSASLVRFQQTGLSSGYTAGTTTVRAECEIDTDSDLSSVTKIAVAAQAAVSGGAIESRWSYIPTAGDYPVSNRLTIDYRGRYPILQSPIMTIPATATSMAVFVDFTGLGTIRVRNIALRANPPT